MPDVEALIESIKALVRSNSEVDSFLDKLHELVAASPVSIGSTYEAGVDLYRATKHHRAVPGRVDELWYPPAEVTPPGRANRRGAPMFYCSSDPNCAFREIGAQVGQLAVHAKWVTSTPMLLHDLGYTSQVLDRAGSRRALPASHRSFYEASLNEQGKTIRDFLALAFTEPTAANYSLTTAIEEFHLRGDQFSGILYPAVSKAANVDNLALRPSFVRESLKLVTAQLVNIDQVGEDGSIGGIVLADLSSVESDGSLRWTFREAGSQVPPGGNHAFRAGERLRAQSPGEIEVEGKRYRINTGYSIEATESGEVTVRDLRGEVVEPLP
jgi:hypothetical protein